MNGIAGDEAADDYELHGGDVVQWDYHSAKVRQDIPAIVGAFPEPFLHGLEGRKFPVRVECEDAAGGACERVKTTLRDAGVPATGLGAGHPGHPERGARGGGPLGSARATCPPSGRWSRARRRSAVFARFSADGDLTLLDESGRAGHATPAATPAWWPRCVPATTQLVWVVTGGSRGGPGAGRRRVPADRPARRVRRGRARLAARRRRCRWGPRR